MYKGIILLVIVIALTMVYHKVKDSPSNKIKEGFENGDDDKILEGFQDIKDIRYGTLGGINSSCNTANKWIKIANVTVSGAWDSRGFTLEVYPRIRYNSSSRQTLICLMRNNGGTDLEEPYVSLTTHNEAAPNSRLIGDVRIVRTAGSGVTGNKLEVYVQFIEPCADSTYVMYYLWNFKVADTVETTPQPMVDKVPGGQAWGVNDRVDPRFIETSAGWVEKVVKNNGSNAYTLQGLWNNAGVRAHLFLNSNDRQADGGPNTATLRNDNGDLRVQSSGGNNIHLKPSGNVGINTANPTAKLDINGDFKVSGRAQHLTDNGDANSEQLIIGNTSESNLRLGKTADHSWIQSHGAKPLKINPLGNEVILNDVVIKGNVIFEHPNGQRWVMGLRDQNHLAINKFDRPGFLIREDGNVWTGQAGAGYNGGGDAEWRRWWQHNSQLGRR